MSTVAENKTTLAALGYAGLGWKLVPAYGLKNGGCECRAKAACNSAGKHPRIMEWQNNATDDEETIDRWFTQWPNSNIGVRLGPQSGIIDIEFDDEEGREVADRLLGECHTPTYSSGRSVHRLFKFSEELPHQKAVTKKSGLEFRFGTEDKGSQSILPPSRHHSGKQYTWLPGLSPAEVGDIADIPDSILAIIHNLMPGESAVRDIRPRSDRYKLYDQPEVIEGIDGRDNVIHAESCAMWREQVLIHGEKCLDDPQTQKIVFERLWAFSQAKCKPPLSNDDVSRKCNGGRDFIRKAEKTTREESGPSLTELGLEFRDSEWWPGLWKVDCVNSDPPTIRLYAPFLPKKFIELLPEEYDSAHRVHLAVFGATGTIYLNDGVRPWDSIWKGSKKKSELRRALAAKLLDDANKVEAPREVKRPSVLAQFVLGFLFSKNLPHKGADDPVSSREHRFMRGEEIFFHFDALLEQASFNKADKLTRNELSKCVQAVGVKDRKVPVGDGKQRKSFMILGPIAIKHLRLIADGGEDEAHANTPI